MEELLDAGEETNDAAARRDQHDPTCAGEGGKKKLCFREILLHNELSIVLIGF